MSIVPRFFRATKKDNLVFFKNGHLLEFQKCPKVKSPGVL